MIIVLFVVLFFIVLRFVVSLFNFISDPKLRRTAKPYQDLVSILIPARNEETNILNLLQSIHRQDYSQYEVIILDDDSSDDTFAICEAFAAAHPKFTVMKGKPLLRGWLGKNYACYQLAAMAKGKYLLFVDADETLYEGLLNSAVHRMGLHRLTLLSLFTNQQMVTAGEKMVVPLMHYVLLNLLPLQLVRLVKSASVAAASGQFMLFDAAHYHQNQWHEQVQHKVVEDVEIMRLVKGARLNGEALLANNMISCRMYTGYRDAIAGFSKNFLAAFNYSILGLLIYIVLLIGGPLLVFSTLDWQLITFMTTLILLSRAMISFTSGQNAVINILLHPFQMLMMAFIAFLAIQKHLTKTTLWKGRKV